MCIRDSRVAARALLRPVLPDGRTPSAEWRVPVLVDQAGRADEAESLFDAVVVIQVHLVPVPVVAKAEGPVVVMVLVVKRPKIRAALDGGHGVSREAVVGDEVARGGVSVRGESIDQASDAHGSHSRRVDAMRDRSARWAVAGWTPGRGGGRTKVMAARSGPGSRVKGGGLVRFRATCPRITH